MAASVEYYGWLVAALRALSLRDWLSLALGFAVGFTEMSTKRQLPLPLSNDGRKAVAAHLASSVWEHIAGMSHISLPTRRLGGRVLEPVLCQI